jgi:hypothetical protein
MNGSNRKWGSLLSRVERLEQEASRQLHLSKKIIYRLWFPSGPDVVPSRPDIETMERNGRMYWRRRLRPETEVG